MKESLFTAFALALSLILVAGVAAFTVTDGVQIAEVSVSTRALTAMPAEYVGDWAGSVGNINLSFTVNEDGSGIYAFEQGGYAESYDFTLSVDSDAFTVNIPADNRLGIVACGGVYSYADGVLTLAVRTQMRQGPDFTYTVSCERVTR